MNLAKVTFSNSNRLYTYKVPESIDKIEAGDLVVVKAPHEFKVVKVMTLHNEEVADKDALGFDPSFLKPLIMTWEHALAILFTREVIREFGAVEEFDQMIKDSIGETFLEDLGAGEEDGE